MIDFLTPLGRPPLDTLSPSQEVRTAVPLPSGEWEIEAGAAVRPGGVAPIAGIRGGIGHGVELDLNLPSAARPMVDVAYGLLPGLAAVDFSATIPDRASVAQLGLGSQLQLDTPWGTPRIAPRVEFRTPEATGPGSSPGDVWDAKLDFGYEIPITMRLAAGADLDLATHGQSSVSLGLRARFIANVGAALYGTYLPASQSFSGGLIVASKFFGGRSLDPNP